jgi:hypothetical protein
MSNATPTNMITVVASGSIMDPELVHEFVQIWPRESPSANDPNVVEVDTRLDLFGGQVVLFFSKARFLPFIPEPRERFPYYHLWSFLNYRSRINYNILHPELMRQLPALEPAPEVVFSLSRLVRVEREEQLAGHTTRVWHYETVPAPVTITASEFEDLLRVCTFQLYLAMAYYLIGCEHPRYFLVEFYKAVEVIENALGGERKAIDALTPYGLVRADFKRLKRYANDALRPFDVGRHAPLGTDLRVIDLRRLLEEPVSRQVFSEAASAARQAIDAYFDFLRS